MNLNQQFLSMALHGAGWVLAVLVALSLISIAVMTERWIVYRRIARREQVLARMLEARPIGWQRIGGRSATIDTPGARMLSVVLRARAEGSVELPTVLEAARATEKVALDERLGWLGTIAGNAPFVGLFGTVIEILRVFDGLGQAGLGASGSSAVMTGISEALVATGVGLLVAIPASAAYNALLRRAGALLTRAQQTAALGFERPGEAATHGGA